MQNSHERVKTLLDALPFIKKFNNEIIVVKYGGAAQTSDELKEKFTRDMVLLWLVGMRPVIVHGGGKSITSMLEHFGVESKFVDGQRVTCLDSMKIAEMVLSGEINKEIVALLNNYGAKAIGISGKDGRLIEARAKDFESFGYTGVVEKVNPEIVNNLINEGFIPVIAPIASSTEVGHPGFNINADLAASKIAIALQARKILFLTDTVGVMDKEKNLLTKLGVDQTNSLIADGTIHGGMVPKVNACLEAIKGGVKKAHIIDGRVEHSILLEILTSEGVGTCFE